MKEENITNPRIKIDFLAFIYSHFTLKLAHKHSKRSKHALFASFGTKLLHMVGIWGQELGPKAPEGRNWGSCNLWVKSSLWASPDSENSHHQPHEAIPLVSEQASRLHGGKEWILERKKALVRAINIFFLYVSTHISSFLLIQLLSLL